MDFVNQNVILPMEQHLPSRNRKSADVGHKVNL